MNTSLTIVRTLSSALSGSFLVLCGSMVVLAGPAEDTLLTQRGAVSRLPVWEDAALEKAATCVRWELCDWL